MSDFDKLIMARDQLRKARNKYIEEFSDFLHEMIGTDEELKQAQYLHGKTDAICTAFAIINNLIESE